MTTPHDYYANEPFPLRDPHRPELHNRGEGKHYMEPDWFANHHDGALPTLSTIGKGPQGYGIKFHKDNLGNLVIGSDDPMQDSVTYHLGDWNIWVTQKNNGEIIEGQNTEFDIHISDGTNVKKKTIIVPCGSHGSRVYFSHDEHAYSQDNVYQIRSVFYPPSGTPHEVRFPEPRTGDLVLFTVTGYDDEFGPYPNGQIATGTIEAFGEDSGGQFITVFAPVLLPVPVYRYEDFQDKPQINGVTLSGNKTTADLGLFSGDYDDLTNKPELFSGDYNDLENKPELFNGDYSSLSNIPTIGVVGDFHSIVGDLDLYNDLGVPYCQTWGTWDPSSPTNIRPVPAYYEGGTEWIWPLNYDASAEMWLAAGCCRSVYQQVPFSTAPHEDRLDFTFNYQCTFYEDADWADIFEVINDHGLWIPIIGEDLDDMYLENALSTGSAFFTTSDGSTVACPIRVKVRDDQNQPLHGWVCEVRLPSDPQIVRSFTSAFISGTFTAVPPHNA